MKKLALLFLFFFLPSLSSLTYAHYSLYPGECMTFATEVSTYNFCIPANASANETFTFQYEVLVHKETVSGTRYITQPIYYENTTKIEELNETIEKLNSSLSDYKTLYKHYENLFEQLYEEKKYYELTYRNLTEQLNRSQQRIRSLEETIINQARYIEQLENIKSMVILGLSTIILLIIILLIKVV